MTDFVPLPDFAAFAGAFPFHLVITPALKILSAGDGLARMAPDIISGDALDAHFHLQTPNELLSWTLLMGSAADNFCLIHRNTGLELRGRIVRPAGNGPVVFLGKSWLDDAGQLADFGLDAEHLDSASTTSGVADLQMPLSDFSEMSPHELRKHCVRFERCLRLHQVVSRCLAETDESRRALSLLVESLPKALHWAAASLWRKGAKGKLQLEQDWPFGAGIAAPTDDRSSHPAAGLAEKTFLSGAPQFTQTGCAGRGGFALPLNTQEGTVAVLCCASSEAEPEDIEFTHQLYVSSGEIARHSARQQSRKGLSRLTSELTAVFQLSADGFVVFNDLGDLSYLNPAFARMIGVERNDLIGLSETEFEQRLAPMLAPSLPADKKSEDAGREIVRLHQPRTTVLERARRDARDIEGRITGRVLYFRDITLETELLRANGEFLSNAAHELRTPMASIHGFVELLLKREFPAVQQRKLLETIFRQSSRLSEIVDELLEVARFDARAARDLTRSVQGLIPLVEATIDELLIHNDGRVVAFDSVLFASAPLMVSVDRDRFVQALTNVLSNAYKYSPAGGAIEVFLEKQVCNNESWVGVVVRDHGIGMSEDEQAHLFERFYRAHPSGNIPGTGLGLSMVKKIIDAHGGRVQVRSAPGDGTQVTLWLPIYSPPVAPGA